MDFHLLPQEIKFHILSYLTEDELSGKVAVVSKEWRLLAEDPYLRTNLEITKRNLQNVCELLNNYRRIRNLRLIEIDEWDWIPAMPRITLLRRLELFNCRFTSVDTISQIIARTPYIRSLVISNCKNSTNCMSQIPTCKLLKIISFGMQHDHNYDYYDTNCTCADAFFENVGDSQEITIEFGCSLTDSGFLKLAKFSGSHLQKLTLHGNKRLTDTAYQTLRQFPRLVHLSILGAKGLDKAGLASIKLLSQLQSLEIYFCEDNFIQFFNGALFPQLTTLSIDSYHLRDQTLQFIAESCPRLLQLELSSVSSHISDSGIISIIEICSSLQELYLLGLSSLRGTFLNRIQVLLPNLNQLYLDGCYGILSYYYMLVKQQKPSLRIRDPEGLEVLHDATTDYEYYIREYNS